MRYIIKIADDRKEESSFPEEILTVNFDTVN
jgi:hypothetical protein